MPSDVSVCVFCGAMPKRDRILAGRNGAICVACLGRAFQAITRSGAMLLAASGLTGNRRCLLCDSGVVEWRAVAFRGPFCVCDACLLEQFSAQLAPAGQSALAFRL